jgi:UDP-N-acetylglucosamine 4,6-dehydratase
MTPDGGGTLARIECVLITGGTGSFGAAFTRFLLSWPNPPRIRIYSRDEHKQEDFARALNDDRVTFILGDIRDGERMRRALDGCDALVHAAALKVVSQGEMHVSEFVGVNVTGSRRVAEAAIDAGVQRSLLISSDKAVEPINTYGMSKALAERIFIYANRQSVSRGLKFAAVRGGNVWASRGSVVEVWKAQRDGGHPLDVYNPDTLRFHLPMPDWTAFVWRALSDDVRVHDARNGDKAGELLIARHESQHTVDVGWAYVVEPPADLRAVWNYRAYGPADGAVRVPAGLRYGSDTVPRLSVDELRRML